MNEHQDKLYGAIEAGGTKFVCAIGRSSSQILDRVVIPTRGPEETLRDVISYFQEKSAALGELKTVGVGSFGPIDIDIGSQTLGHIIQTPKLGWSGTNLLDTLYDAIGVPVALDTDVNCALIAEVTYGAGRGLSDVIYLTVGTGIGGGIMSNGKVVYGSSHPEIGHIFFPKEPDDTFDGICLYHGDRCIEGLASGPAMTKRWGVKPSDMPSDHIAWDLEARYLAGLCYNLMMLAVPQRVILGGGVMKQTHIFPLIRQKLHALINEYGAFSLSTLDLSKVIVPPALQGDAGIIGAIEIARSNPDTTDRCFVGLAK